MTNRGSLAAAMAILVAALLGITPAGAQGEAPAADPPAERSREKSKARGTETGKDRDTGRPADAGERAARMEAEIAFWNSVKDSGKPDELRAYLKQYPKGRFAELARLRIKEAEGAPAAAAPKASGNAAGGAQTSTGVVREVQDRLYKLNFDIRRFDGALDEDTERAIKLWQRGNGFAPSGLINSEQLVALRAIVPASTWGAIAFPVQGSAVTVSAKPSRREAEQVALAGCRTRHNVACKVHAIPGPMCLSIVSAQWRTPAGQGLISHFFQRDTTASGAALKAMSICNNAPGRGNNPCKLLASVCGAGTGEQAPAGAGGGPSAPPPAQRKRKPDAQDA